jgi:hypothetical protein
MVITTAILFYNTELEQYHRMTVHYYSKKFYKIETSADCTIKPITAVI